METFQKDLGMISMEPDLFDPALAEQQQALIMAGRCTLSEGVFLKLLKLPNGDDKDAKIRQAMLDYADVPARLVHPLAA